VRRGLRTPESRVCFVSLSDNGGTDSFSLIDKLESPEDQYDSHGFHFLCTNGFTQIIVQDTNIRARCYGTEDVLYFKDIKYYQPVRIIGPRGETEQISGRPVQMYTNSKSEQGSDIVLPKKLCPLFNCRQTNEGLYIILQPLVMDHLGCGTA
jgi:hypothetical protein